MKLKMRVTDLALLPYRATAGASGWDLRAACSGVLLPDEWAAIPTGVYLSLPHGYEMQIRPRSGLAFKHGVTVLNAPGTIDADYRGEVKVILVNHGTAEFSFVYADRIAQMVPVRTEECKLQLVESLDETSRGEGGFGSTGNE